MTSQCQPSQNKKPEIWEVVGQGGGECLFAPKQLNCRGCTQFLSWTVEWEEYWAWLQRKLTTIGLPLSHCYLIQSTNSYTTLSLLIKYKTESFNSVVLGMWYPCCYHNITWEHVGHANSWSQSNSVLSSCVGPRPTKLLLWVQGSRFCQASLASDVSPCSSWEVTGQSYHWVNFWFSHSRTLSRSVWFRISEFHTFKLFFHSSSCWRTECLQWAHQNDSSSVIIKASKQKGLTDLQRINVTVNVLLPPAKA